MSTAMNTSEHPRTDLSEESRTASVFRRALTRKQRAQLLANVDLPRDYHDVSKQSQCPFDGDVPLEKRFQAEGLDIDAAHAALQFESHELPQSAEDELQWASAFTIKEHVASDSQGAMPLEAFHPFLVLLQPEADHLCECVRRHTEQLVANNHNAPFGLQAGPAIATNMFAGRVLPMVLRTLALELNVARMQSTLVGETSEARFSDFVRTLKTPEFRQQFFQEYVVLAQQIHQAAEQCQAATGELLERLSQDWESIVHQFFGGTSPGDLAQVHLGAGDTHASGRAVAQLVFETGERLVYKPRCLKLDEQFQALLAWTNDRGFELPFHRLRTLTRAQYGWVEFVQAEDCKSELEAANFFRRQGAFLAVLHAIGGSDIHHENIIARGEHPVLVDLEVLFSPESEIDAEQMTTDAKAAEALATSVVRTGMLPYKVWQAGASEGVDVSGLVDVEGATTPDSVPVWDGQGSDDMQLTRRQVPMEGSQNLPRLHGKRLDVREHQSELLTGFEIMYRLLARHREELLSDDGPLSAFSGLETRVVLRMSRSYGKLQNESFHPDVLRDALDRDEVFDRLWSVVRHQPKMKNIIASEREQLWQGDIPAFTLRANSTDLCTISGEPVSNEYFAQSGLSAAQQRISGFGEDDLAAQKWFIEASLATSEVKRRDWQVSSRVSAEAAARPNNEEKFVEQAIEIGEKLDHLAIHHGKEATWNGLLYAGRKSPIVSPLALDLYEGIPGVAWFLAHLGDVTEEKRFTRLAEKSLNTILGANDRLETELSPGGFYGLGGVIYTLTHLGSLWRRADLIERATKLAHRIPECTAKDGVLDLIAGSTGGLASILTLHSVTKDPALEEIASRCGERLLATATDQACGKAWQLDDLGPVPIVGASHGTAGAAWALLRIASITEREDFFELGNAALAYERSQYDASRQNWPNNMHAEEDAPEFTRWRVQWCHGAPGIGLLRAKMLEQGFDAIIANEVRVAAETTLRAGFGFGHCLCHGDVGNLECLMMMADGLKDDDLRAKAKLQADRVLDSIEEHGARCGVPNGVQTPGLMTGLAGIGYGMLRVAHPELPSVLSMDAPVV